MLNPKVQRYADRFRQLIADEELLCQRFRTQKYPDLSPYMTWRTSSLNLLNLVFGEASPFAKEFNQYTSEMSQPTIGLMFGAGVLKGALSDLEGGFVRGQEFAIASEVFADVLDQAKYLNQHGFKDPAAVLGRTVIEAALRRLARDASLDDTKKPAIINTDLRVAGVYHLPQERQVQVWLDIGNKAAHGDFTAYSQDEVTKMLEGIEGFLALHFI